MNKPSLSNQLGQYVDIAAGTAAEVGDVKSGEGFWDGESTAVEPRLNVQVHVFESTKDVPRRWATDAARIRLQVIATLESVPVVFTDPISKLSR
ncbi:MAG: hypothetical protein ACJAZO_005181 [Myxococcota bacterium]